MISWFARFKHRFGKLQKNMKKRSRKSDAKNIGKSSKKSSKIDAKTMKKPSKNRCGKKVRKKKAKRFSPGEARAPVRPSSEGPASEESLIRKTIFGGGVQRGTCRETNLDPLTRLGRLRARSGYIGPWPSPGLPADPGKSLPRCRFQGGPPPDTGCSTPISTVDLLITYKNVIYDIGTKILFLQ